MRDRAAAAFASILVSRYECDLPSNRAEPAGITRETVRAHVSQVGVAAAKALARAHGVTAVQERRAWQCLASRD
jgi:hypothetical protein